ncbi:site-specific integrase [Micromonospora sp. ALFpr18c]|uniref:tyrosine-type recombinase/integrase n=1 Tax=unclassified Micromonospora TaxID=2617518 RepID=UPI001CEC028A|nr:site-specific integrase [Micromonospora sp. ALFpr18c]
MADRDGVRDHQGEWSAPEAGEIKLDAYGRKWIAERKLQPRSRENYEDLFRLHICPHLGALALGAIKPQTIRTWRRTLLGGGTTEPQAVKAYSLLRAILNTATKEDELIRQNPCRIPGYDRYHTPERPVATVAQVLALAERMPARFSALVIVAAFSGLRWGELAALRRGDVDLAAGTVRVPRKLAALRNRMEFGPPKSEAGNRVVTLPAAARTVLAEHLAEFVGEGPEALVFTGDKGRCCVPATSGGRSAGRRRCGRLACRRGSTFTTCGTRATTWRRRPGPAPGT